MIERALAQLERRFRRFAFGNITYGLLILQAVGFAIVLVHPELAAKMCLSRAPLLEGEWWRLITFFLLPASTGPLWVVFSLYWLYTMGRALEEQWGSFRYELFWIIGVVATYAAVFAGATSATIVPLIMSLFLAFATLWPDYQLRVFFALPVPVKWLALLDAIAIAAAIGSRDGLDRLVPIAAVANYLLFFGPHVGGLVRSFFRQAARGKARTTFKSSFREGVHERATARSCAICGKSEADPDVDIRVCSCEKCGGVDRNLCLEHARDH